MSKSFNKNEFTTQIIDLISNFIVEEIHDDYSSKIDLDTKLFGGDGMIDSMSLVALIVQIEELVEELYDISIVLASETAMSRRTSPFSRVKYLVDYIEELIINDE
jgi:acyl carrier protein